jgi:protein SCO1/2
MENLSRNKKNRNLFVALLVITLIISGSFLCFSTNKPPVLAKLTIDGVYLPEAQEITDFKLTDHNGKPFGKDNLKGSWSFVFFGFSNCGMVCPTTMAALNKMYIALDKTLPKNQLPRIIMISVDPDRDSVTRMKEYVKSFNPNFIGLRGKIEDTNALEKQLHIVAARLETETDSKEHYTINHSAEILIFNPQGNLQAYFSFPHQAEQMVTDYKQIIARK